jgi:hypothetical protein
VAALSTAVGLNVTGAAGQKYYDGILSEEELKLF